MCVRERVRPCLASSYPRSSTACRAMAVLSPELGSVSERGRVVVALVSVCVRGEREREREREGERERGRQTFVFSLRAESRGGLAGDGARKRRALG
jgi:hypothetical protein